MSDVEYQDYDDEEDFVVIWWDDFTPTGKKARDEKNAAALQERLERLYEYCITDVESERSADSMLYPLSPEEQEIYYLDQRINDRGIAIDVPTVKNAINLINTAAQDLDRRLAAITGNQVTAVSQRERMSKWLASRGFVFPTLDKNAIEIALKNSNLPNDVREVLELRQMGSKTSVKKLIAMMNMVEEDGRIRGNLLYHAASTGRFAGKGVQLHNLPRPQSKKPELAIPYIQREAYDEITLCFGNVHNVISDCIRNMVVAGPGKVFYAADFAAIEARVLAWIAGQHDLIEQFANGDDIYLAFAQIIYGRKLNKKEHDKERQVGKAAILGLGFMMGAAKFRATCEKVGIILEEEEYERIVKLYRKQYSKIYEFWYGFERAAIRAIQKPGVVVRFRAFRFCMRDKNLRMQLPSGRVLNYVDAKAVPNKTPWGETRLAIEISAENPKTKKWERFIVSPGTLTENAVQAIARDLMVASMLRVEKHGYPVVLTVHDELVSEVEEGFGTVAEYENLVAATPEWAEGLPVKAEGWSGPRYRK